MRKLKKVLVIAAVLVAFAMGQSTQSWKIWSMNNWSFGVNLYKVQDGTCSVYVLMSDNGRGGDNIALATGQGCH